MNRLVSQGYIADSQEFIQLNRVCFCRVITFNARRGGEPSKLTLDHWEKTMKDTWKRKSDIEKLTDPVEIKLASRLKLCYLPGKKKKKGKLIYLFIIIV